MRMLVPEWEERWTVAERGAIDNHGHGPNRGLYDATTRPKLITREAKVQRTLGSLSSDYTLSWAQYRFAYAQLRCSCSGSCRFAARTSWKLPSFGPLECQCRGSVLSIGDQARSTYKASPVSPVRTLRSANDKFLCDDSPAIGPKLHLA